MGQRDKEISQKRTHSTWLPRVNVHDPGITNLWGAPAGVACLLMNGVATAILLAYLHHRSGKITTWLVTHSHFAAGVSCIWRSDRGEEDFVNLFGTRVWNDFEGDGKRMEKGEKDWQFQ